MQPYYLHQNVMEESNSNAPTYSGTRQESKKRIMEMLKVLPLWNHHSMGVISSWSSPTLSPRAENEWCSLLCLLLIRWEEGQRLFTCPPLV